MFIISLLLAAVTLTPTSTIVQPSPTPTATDEIQKIRNVVQQKVMEKLQQITQPTLTKRGLIGKISRIDPTGLTIDYQDTSTDMNFDDSLVVIDQKRNKITTASLKLGQDILVLGEQKSATDFVAKRIVVFDIQTIEATPKVIIGKIVDISKTSPIFSLIPTKDKNTQYQIKTDTKSIITSTQNEKIASSALKSGNKVIVVLIPDPKMAKTYYAQKIINLDYAPDSTPTENP